MKTIDFTAELKYKAVRSSGKGGQNVNKVATKVELRFDVLRSALLDEAQKELLLNNLKNRLTDEGVLILSSGKERSQIRNKKRVTARFYTILEKGLKRQKKRKSRKIPKEIREARLKNKRRQSEKKKWREKIVDR